MDKQQAQMVINAAVNDAVIRARQQYLSMGGYGIDTKRTTWAQFGYKDNPTFDDYLMAYKRQPAATALIDKMHGKCWGQNPQIKEKKPGDKAAGDEKATAWEKEVDALFSNKGIHLWDAVRDTDKAQMIGRYAGLILRIADNKQLNEPATSGDLVEAIPCYESQLRVTSWEADMQSNDYGMPTMYQYRSSVPQSQNLTTPAPEQWADIHPSRVITFAEGAPHRRFWEGVPYLEACFNKLVDLEKVSGGGAESYLKNSARTMVMEFAENADVAQAVKAVYGPDANVKEKLNDAMRDANTSIDAGFVMQGGTVSTLQVTQTDPTGIWTVVANEIAASKQIPFTILFGQQTGRLASDQDQQDFAKVAQSRQKNAITRFIEDVILRLIKLQCISAPSGDWMIEWPDLLAMSDKDKLANAKTMAETNKSATDAGLPPVYDDNELRAVAGYAPRSEQEEADLLAKMQQAQPDPVEPENTPEDDAEDAKEEGIVNAFRAWLAANVNRIKRGN